MWAIRFDYLNKMKLEASAQATVTARNFVNANDNFAPVEMAIAA